jgi:hypothetical protein
MTAVVSEEERWLRIGLLAGVDKRSTLEEVLKSTSSVIDAQIATVEKSIEDVEKERLLHEKRFLELNTLVNQSATKWSGLLGNADSGDTAFRRLEQNYTTGLWIAVALVGMAVPSLLSWSQHTSLFEALPKMLLWAILATFAVLLCAFWLVPAARLRRIACHGWTLPILATLVMIGTLLALVGSESLAWTNIIVMAAVAGVAWTCWLKQRQLKEPVLSDLRRRLDDARDTTARMEREQRQRLAALEQTQTDLYAQLRQLRHDKQMVQRKVSEGYLLGLGLRGHSNTSHASS